MQIERYALTEAGVLCFETISESTVTITLYNLSDGSAVALDSDVCTEIGTTGSYYWPLSNITTYPTSFAEYHYIIYIGATAKDAGKVTLYDLADTTEGANLATVSIEDASDDPIVGVSVQCWNSSQTVMLDVKTSDSNGEVVFALDDGIYKLVCSKSQVSFTIPETLTVSGTTALTVDGNVLTIATPTDSTVCRVFDHAYNAAGSQPLSSLTAYATITTLPMSASSKLHSGVKVKATYSPADGLFYWDLVQGAVVDFKCEALGIQGYTRTVPSSSTARLSSIAA